MVEVPSGPQMLCYDDEEGFLKKLDVIEWLEAIGVKLEPVAGGWRESVADR